MAHFNLTPQWLCPEYEILLVGILEIVELQEKGYAYIKPCLSDYSENHVARLPSTQLFMRGPVINPQWPP